MKKLFLLLILCGKLNAASYAWQTNQVFYWFNYASGIALSTNVVAAASHAASVYTSCQIGNSTGVLTNLCTGFNVDCMELDCTWGRDHLNVLIDTMWHIPCRPVTNGITYIANVTNLVVGTPVVWYSQVAHQWIEAQVYAKCCHGDDTFADGMTGTYGLIDFIGQQPVGGDSSSPIFTLDGDYIGGVWSISSTNLFAASYMFPNNATLRPVTPTPPSPQGSIGTILNSDPDN